MSIDAIICMIAGPVFLISLCAHIIVKIRLRPRAGDLDDYYEEFEHLHPAFARYTKWSNITFTAAVIAALLLFLAMVI